MLELVDAYQSNNDVSKIKGIVYRSGDTIIRNGERPYCEDLDSLPFPARDLIPQHLFAPNMHNARYRNCLSILTSRGCPFNCSFCAARLVSGKKYRMHSAEYVLEEMQLLKKNYQARQLLITDDTFTINHERLEKICRGMIDRKLGLEWFCFSQVTAVNKDVLSMMKKAGCYSIGFGIESSDETILRNMGKPISPARSLEAVRLANKAGLKTQAFYILGSPGETRAQMEDTVRFSRKVNAVLSFYNMLVPYPGTKEFEHFFAGVPLENIDWEKFVAVGSECVIRNSEVLARDIERMIGKANMLYYMHPGRLLRLLFHIRSSYELFNYVRGGAALLEQAAGWFATRKTADKAPRSPLR